MKYLPDTNVFIRAMNGFWPEANFLKKHIKELALSVIVIAEVWAKPQGEEKVRLQELIGELDVIGIDIEIAREAGEYRSQMVKRSGRGYLQDCFLAAQAKVHHLTLVTSNKADFPMRDIKVITP